MSILQGKVCVVTGGARGIGSATAELLAYRGADVVICDLPDSGGQQRAHELKANFLPLDVTSEQQWKDAMDAVINKYGKLDVMVNAAGIVGDVLHGALDQMTLEDWRRVLAVNLDGTFLACREALRVMKSGAIVNISSVGGYYPTTQNAAYGASKGAVTQLTKTVALFGADDGRRVRCNSVHPGQIGTEMLQTIRKQKLARVHHSPTRHVSSVDRIPLGEGKPGEVAHLIAFLVSDEASYITGAEFTVDGGWRLVR